ncbi:glycine--tRNA ligase [Haladaptatus pallidirubidus]|uniref:glycine--tRNA ligase n=1 Tax=Haladaptatus pallidirubidus TaxID=1008152 RepID=A0AAV3UFE8_9EURY|nr:glycine--tRNA ligase [Haladaptatus pallidirubidus]
MSDELVELAKRRGFFFQAAEPYGGVSGFYVYGPQGATLKRNIEDSWRDRFQVEEGHREIDAPTIMPEPVFEASGHLDTFDDMLVECPECGESHRADHLIEDNTGIEDAESFPLDEVGDLIADHDLHCPNCDTPLAGEPVEDFNLMFETDIGPGSGQPGYLRPETAQGIFVEFPRLKEYARNSLPFGTTQIGKAYRNEISPRKSIVRVRELTQAELEHFIDPEEDEPPIERVEDVEVRLYPTPEQNADEGEYIVTTIGEAVEEGIIASDWVAYYVGVAQEWYERIGIDMNRFRFRQHLAGERSHYASDCWDAEGEIDGDWVELAGISDRSDYDLSKHGEYSDDDFTVFRQYDEPKVVERATVEPDMSYLGPEFGGAAGDITDALQTLAERDRSAFDGDEVTVEADGESYTIPIEKTGFSVDEVKESGEHITPHVIEPSIGVDRALYTVLVHSYEQDDVEDETRTRLALEPELAPTTVGVFPLMDKDGMGETARDIAADLRANGFDVTYDDSGNIGRRYRRQDEVGTPFCVTVDYEGLEDDTVTLRERDSTEQVRVAVSDLDDILADLRSGDRAFSNL